MGVPRAERFRRAPALEEQYGWFDNPHWDFPMYPRRFAESLCLKCHHRVVDLEPSERFPDPPAPKLLEGYRLIRSYGCFGCHDIDGYSRPGQRVAPDLRLEPNVCARPRCSEGPRVAPGTLRRRRPSLRRCRQCKPRRTVPVRLDPARRPIPADGTHAASVRIVEHCRSRTEEQLESLADLQHGGLPAASGVKRIALLGSRRDRSRLSAPPSSCRRKSNAVGLRLNSAVAWSATTTWIFRTSRSTGMRTPCELGPDLSNTAAKFAPDRHPRGSEWLYSWIKQPVRYDVRTTMPDAQLESGRTAG